MSLRDLPINLSVDEREKKVLDFWNSHNIFKKTENRPGWLGIFNRKEYVFYDGPPFATGTPHYGHINASTIKDAIPRYKTMRGYTVKRRWGWDCHGLPLENLIEKKINLNSKRDIEEYGIENFNNQARDAVFTFADDWKKFIPRIGRFVDMENDYRTMSLEFMESVWYIFNKIAKRGYVLESFKTVHFCPRCSTVVSNSEVSDNYKDVEDTAVFARFTLVDEPDTDLIAWTTTPWTLLGNVALAVSEDIEYAVVRQDKRKYIVSKKFAEGQEIEKIIKGKDLIGKEYSPPFDSHYLKEKREGDNKIWKIYNSTEVNEEVGTGILHLAPAYGESDMELASKEGLPIKHHVDKEGRVIDTFPGFEGMLVKTAGKPSEVDTKVVKDLEDSNKLFKKEQIVHSYPFCWRCETPLLNYATDSFFIDVPKYRSKMIKENKKINWVPDHIKNGRFGNWISMSGLWAVSRSRYWGTPLPVWKNKDSGEYIIMSSAEEMNKYAIANNKYHFIRHGLAQSNVDNIFNCINDGSAGLTEEGKGQVMAQLGKLKELGITKIIASPIQRTKETAEIISNELGIEIEYDDALTELYAPDLNGRPISEFYTSVMAILLKVHGDDSRVDLIRLKKIGGGESFAEVRKRVFRFLRKMEGKYKGETILAVSHKIVLTSLSAIEKGEDMSNALCEKYFPLSESREKIVNAYIRTIKYIDNPRNESGILDLHRPYIDRVTLVKNGKEYTHIKEVFDCWFESGSMPYASQHFPFNKTSKFSVAKNKGFPADFIAEGLDQTRGWFNSLLNVGVAAFDKAPYKNVIVTGIVRAADGKKMSKSLNNYTDPSIAIEKFGADSLRHYLLKSPLSKGQDFDFKDEDLAEINRKVYGRLHNSLNFYRTYKDLPHKTGSKELLDVYLISRLEEMRKGVMEGFEEYKLYQAIPFIDNFVDDLSTWYIRRSRDRAKDESDTGAHARETLRFALLETSKIIAPVAPFYAEYLYQNLNGPKESVHLENFPSTYAFKKASIDTINKVREIVSQLHEERNDAGIKVRQVLAKAYITEKGFSKEVEEMIKQEVNVKEVVQGSTNTTLEKALTQELKNEGFVREVTRVIQNERKNKGYNQADEVEVLKVMSDDETIELLKSFEEEIMVSVRVKKIEYGSITGNNTKEIEGKQLEIGI